MWPYKNFEPKIIYLDSLGWRVLIRKDNTEEWKSIEESDAVHATPDEALAAVVARIEDLLRNRQEALAIEVVNFMVAIPTKLRPVNVPDPLGGGGTVRYWQARGDDGLWSEALATPYEAVRVALRR